MRLFGSNGDAAVARRGPRRAALAFMLLAWPITGLHADDEPTFRIEFNAGKVSPQRIEVPALTRFKLELHNLGREPAEFESKELRKEKVLAPGSSSTLVIRTLDPGEYPFFDDFHLDAPPAVLIAR